MTQEQVERALEAARKFEVNQDRDTLEAIIGSKKIVALVHMILEAVSGEGSH